MPRVMPPPHGSRYVVDKNGYIRGLFLIDGKRRQRGLGELAPLLRTDSGRKRSEKQIEAAVEALWHDKRAQLEKAAGPAPGPKVGIKQVMGDWIAAAPANGIAESTVKLHYEVLKEQYIAGVGDHLIGEMSIHHVDRFKRHLVETRKQGPVTVNMRLGRLGTFLYWAKDRGYIHQLPKIEKLKLPRKVARIPDVEQVQKFIARLFERATTHPNKRQRYYYELHFMLLLFVLCTGVRRGGPLFTPWDKVYLPRAAMLMPKVKGGEELLLLPGLLAAYLENRRDRYPGHKWLFDNGHGEQAYTDPHAATTAFKRHQVALGFADLEIKPIHGMRANFATVSLVDLGMDSRTVSQLLAHSSFKTTEAHYLADREKEKRRALETFEKGYLTGVIDENLLKSQAWVGQIIDIKRTKEKGRSP